MELETSIQKFISFLRSVTQFEEDSFNIALPFFEIRHLQKGEYFIKKNKTCRYFAFVVSGIMRAIMEDETDESTTCICNENAFATSTVSFINQTPSNISIQALDHVVLLTISYSNLQKLYYTSAFWQKVGRIVAEREFMSEQNTSWRNSHIPATEKYLTLLKENPGIINKVPLQYIASYLHIKPETLSRIRKKISTRIS
jgi:hypothetical protein